jgi:hypothetical protein
VKKDDALDAKATLVRQEVSEQLARFVAFFGVTADVSAHVHRANDGAGV